MSPLKHMLYCLFALLMLCCNMEPIIPSLIKISHCSLHPSISVVNVVNVVNSLTFVHNRLALLTRTLILYSPIQHVDRAFDPI